MAINLSSRIDLPTLLTDNPSATPTAATHGSNHDRELKSARINPAATANKGEAFRPRLADHRGKAAFAAMQRSASASIGGGNPHPSLLHVTGSPPSKATIPASILQTVLQNLSIDPPHSDAVNPASQPYAPVTLEDYPNYGGQMKVKVQCTDYARQAAELLIDKNGELDASHIPLMLHQLKTNQTLPYEQRMHLMLTLAKLQNGGELAETINSICKDKPLKGSAAAIVRGTLNLPPAHELTSTDARKAVVMSLLGYLRQGEVGSCFATAPAICLHGSSPEVVASDMKELLEEQKLTFLQSGVLFEAPLNQHVFHPQQPVTISVREDGTFLQQQSNGSWGKHQLHVIPGVKAALHALGIPENEQQAAIVTALSQLRATGEQNPAFDLSGMKAALDALGIEENEQQARIEAMLSQMGVSSPEDAGHYFDCREIIACIAKHSEGAGDPDKRLAAALRAFNGTQDVGLLQTWEYTLTTFAVSEIAHFNAAIFSPDTQPKIRPDLQSPREVCAAFVAQLSADSRFGQTELGEINLHLVNEIEKLYSHRFTYQYDLNIVNPLASDGMTGYGGSTLYEKDPLDNPSQWKRLDNADAFQDAMAQLVKDACDKAVSHVEGMKGDSVSNKDALQLMTNHLVEHIQGQSFIEHAVLRMNPEAANDPFGDVGGFTKTPWRMPLGSNPASIALNYGSGIFHSKNYWTTEELVSTGAPAIPANIPPKKEGDAVDFVHFICEGLALMAPKLQAKAQESPDGFKIPISHGPHAFTLLPMAMKELWLDHSMTPAQWVNAHLKEPANKWLEAPRVTPPLSMFMGALGVDIGAAPEQMQTLYNEISEEMRKKTGSNLNFEEPPYTYGDLYRKLCDFFLKQENGIEMHAKVQATMSKLAIPARIVGDTNWLSEAGRSQYMGIMYNPFAERIEVQGMHLDGSNRKPFGDFNTWFGDNVISTMFGPLTNRIKPEADKQ